MKPSFVCCFAILLNGCMDYSVSIRTITDAYVQPVRESGVDILWVVDNSASMFEEQDQLALHADSFISYLSMAPVDYQLGIATTDMDVEQPGAFVGAPLSGSTPNMSNVFADMIVMDEGSRDEFGFDAALLALDPNGPNGDILRSSADLEIIFFTDEDEQSDISVDEFMSELSRFRGDTSNVVNAIVGDPPEGCASIFGAADAGLKYQEAQEVSDGLRESICSLDYDAMLNRIALKVLGLQNTFKLTAPPSLNTLEVKVDGISMHRRQRHGWSYDAGLNAIILDGYAVPYPGSEVVIKYAQWVGPQDGFENQIDEETDDLEE